MSQFLIREKELLESSCVVRVSPHSPPLGIPLGDPQGGERACFRAVRKETAQKGTPQKGRFREKTLPRKVFTKKEILSRSPRAGYSS